MIAMERYFHFYHIAQSYIGNGLAAFAPVYLMHNYESDKKWLGIDITIFISMVLQGNINYVPWEPAGAVTIFMAWPFYGDIGSVGVFLEILVMPILWLLAFRLDTRPLNRGKITAGIQFARYVSQPMQTPNRC